jgi:ESCRT-I complex subunit VPS28
MDTVKLYNNPREREMFEGMADLFSIIKTTEALEKAYVRDAITAEEYKKHCSKLITQFKAAQNLTKDSVPDIRKFMQDYRLNCKAAEKRLIEEGIPLSGGTTDDTARTVAETVQHFITLMDSLKLNMTAVDQIHPLLTDLLESLSKISSLSPEWEGKVKIKNWLVILNKMKASDELNPEQIRQMLFDLESSYNAFHKSLSG